MAVFTRRYWLAFALLGIGLLMAILGFSAQGRPRTNLEDNISWCVWGVGISLFAAGVTLFFDLRPLATIVIAIASPFIAFCLLVIAFWTVVVFHLYLSSPWPTQAVQVKSGYPLIAEARQIDDLFGPAWHSLVNFQEPNIIEWQTLALFGGRYEMTMFARAEIDRQSGLLQRFIGTPRFMLSEIASVQGRMVSYRNGYELNAEEWKKVVAANGDFTAIGISIDLNHPVPGFSDYQKSPRNGIQMTEDKNPRIAK